MQQYDVVIVGAGHNGLTCAAYLGMAGLKVKVVERREIVGGAAVTEEFHPGFRNSIAAYTVSLLNPKVISDLRLHEHGLRIVERRAQNFLPAPDGRYLLSGEGRTASGIAKLSPRDAERYAAFDREIDMAVDVLRELVLRAPPNLASGMSGLGELIKAGALGRKLKRLPDADLRTLYTLFTRSAGEHLDNWFEDDLVKALLGFDAVVGFYGSPYTPGTGYVLLHHAFGEVNGKRRVWGHAVGGMGAISDAMAKAAASHGVGDRDRRAGARAPDRGRPRTRGGVERWPRDPRQRRRGQRQSQAVLHLDGPGRRARRRIPAPHAGLPLRLRHVPDEPRAVGIAELHRAAGPHARRSSHRRHRDRAEPRLHGPRLYRRARAWLEQGADRRAGDSFDARRHAGAEGRACRVPVLPAGRARASRTAAPGTTTRTRSPT